MKHSCTKGKAIWWLFLLIVPFGLAARREHRIIKNRPAERQKLLSDPAEFQKLLDQCFVGKKTWLHCAHQWLHRLHRAHQFFSEPIYKIPGLQWVHNKVCGMVGINDVDTALARLPNKSPSRLRCLVSPLIREARSCVTKRFLAQKVAEVVINRFISTKQFDRTAWLPWVLSWVAQSWSQSAIRVVNLLTGFPGLSLSSWVSSYVYMNLTSDRMCSSAYNILPESVKNNQLVQSAKDRLVQLFQNKVSRFVIDLYGKELFKNLF